jgi:aminoglycoside phosphotransferase (APT) family kinase protein
MSTVFTARDNALGRTVVIKVLPYELAATVSVERFKREIMLSAALQHPHIVPVLSAGEMSDASPIRLPFFIMPFVEGESLRARLSRGPLSVREAVSILKDVSRALVYAHGRTRLDLGAALLVSGDTTWRQLVEQAAERQRTVARLFRQLDRVRELPDYPDIMDSRQEHPAVWKHGYQCGVLAAKSAARNERATAAEDSG